jgi:hypothetical protein
MYYIARILAVLNRMEFVMHHSLTELMTDKNKRQSCGELMTLEFWDYQQMLPVYGSEENR